MKKFLPAIFISLVFTLMMISQMLINGQELSASRIEQNRERFSLYEAKFHKFKAVDTKKNEIELTKIETPIIIVNFWASWCAPCIAEFASMNKLIQKYPSKITVVGINNDTDNPAKAVLKIERKYKLLFNSVIDPEGKFAEDFNVSKIPSSIIYHKGKVIKFSGKEMDFMDSDFLALIEAKFTE